MLSQCEQDEIADYTLPTYSNESIDIIHSTFKSSNDTNVQR